MFLKKLFLRRIDALFNATTQQEKDDSVISLRSLVETTFENLRPNALVWGDDANDPDVRNASDKVCSLVWQVEDLDELIVVRVFDPERKMVLKVKMSPGTHPEEKIERTRELMFRRHMRISEAWGHVVEAASPETTAKVAPLMLRNPVQEDQVVDL